ncbi:MAG: sugar ABC transporter permease [Clostridia bacterium]|nr:sugar ABC transporter permease [Clostridia bacterium]
MFDVKRKNALKNSGFATKKTKRLLFYLSVVILPMIQFAIFYVGVNFRNILLAFQSYDIRQGTYNWDGLNNFLAVFNDIASLPFFFKAIQNSLIFFACSWGLGVTLGLLFSFYIYKKFTGSNFFKVILFLPSIVSEIVMVLMYKYFVENAVPNIISSLTGNDRVFGLLSNPNTAYATLLFYNIWFSFGGTVLMYSGTMSGIDPAIVEAAVIDGITPIKEFWYITLPMIYPTMVVLLSTGVVGLFTNQMGLYSFFGAEAEPNLYTLGYYLYKETQTNLESPARFPYLSAFGLLLTVVATPLTYLVKNLMEKFGPSVE